MLKFSKVIQEGDNSDEEKKFEIFQNFSLKFLEEEN
jgi:hypothetical protein